MRGYDPEKDFNERPIGGECSFEDAKKGLTSLGKVIKKNLKSLKETRLKAAREAFEKAKEELKMAEMDLTNT